MKDTTDEMDALYEGLLMARSPVERHAMAGRMFMSAKKFVLAAIAADGVEDPVEIRVQLFLRIYGDDFTPAEGAKIVAWIRAGRR